MNIMNRVTWRSLAKNKKRTIVTVIGVIISTAMLTAVLVIALSFLNFMQRYIIRETGEWQILVSDIPPQTAELLEEQYSEIDSVIVGYSSGYFKPKSDREEIAYLYLSTFSGDQLDRLPYPLTEGRYPQSSDEIAISKAFAAVWGHSIAVGDTIRLEPGERYVQYSDGTERLISGLNAYVDTTELWRSIGTMREYTVVGFIDDSVQINEDQPIHIAITQPGTAEIASTNAVYAFLSMKQVDSQIFEFAHQLKQELSGTVDLNESLLMYYGLIKEDYSVISNILGAVVAILAAIIFFSSISLIYNAFSISLSERSRYLGMLSSIGATKTQKRNSVLFEGVVIGIFAVPAGILCGVLGITITFAGVNSALQALINTDVNLQTIVNPWAIISIFCFAFLMILISAWIPALRASRITAISAMRQNKDITVKQHHLRTGRLTRKIFGFEAELALKNIKRNRHRYLATIFSIFSSIVLFLASTGFMYCLQDAFSVSQDNTPLDIEVYVNNLTPSLQEQLLSVDYAQTAYCGYKLYCSAEVDHVLYSGQMQQFCDDYGADLTDLPVQIVALDQKTFDTYAATCDFEEREGTNCEFQGILVNRFRMNWNGFFQDFEQLNLRTGTVLQVSDDNYESDVSFQLMITTTTDLVPPGYLNYRHDPFYMVVLVPQEQMLAYQENYPAIDEWTFGYTSDAPDQLYNELSELREGSEEYYWIGEYYIRRLRNQRIIFVTSVFVYGFIALIAMVSISNIFNTISTSVSLRKREFAMLRSVGISPEGFSKMLRWESMFYALKALQWGIPVGVILMLVIALILDQGFANGLGAFPWYSILWVIVAVFAVIGATMIYSARKVKKDNIVDALKNENL